MRSTLCAAGVGALVVLTLASCGSEGGTGASTASTITISAPEFVTIPPITDATTTTTAAATPGGGEAPVGTVATAQDYTVAAGDYVFAIASKHCLAGQAGAESIASFNEWADGVNHPLNPGDVIKIPPGACVNGGSATAETDPPSSEPATGDTVTGDTTPTSVDPSVGGTYTVKAGDYLSGIAANTGTTVDAIIEVNGWTDGIDHKLFPGDEIKLPAKTG